MRKRHSRKLPSVPKFTTHCRTGKNTQTILVVQSVASPTADAGVANSIPVRSFTFVEIDHEKNSTVR